MTVTEYARLHGLPWSTAKKRLNGSLPWEEWVAAGCPKGDPRRLPPEKVARIRAMLAEADADRAAGRIAAEHWWIAEQVGCSRSTVSHIKNGKRHGRTA